MDFMKAKLAILTQDKRFLKRAAIVFVAALLLIVCLCISISMRSNIQKKYSATIHRMQDAIYQNLDTMIDLFARVEDPTVDVPHKLLPEMRARYYTVAALNSILIQSGKGYAVLSDEQLEAFDAAFEQYAAANRQGSPTGLAKADMQACIDGVQPMVDAYNAPAESPEDDVVIINASSGEIQNSQSK